MPSKKKTKIVATLGPATNKKDTLRDMINSGVDVFRINFSHADYSDVEKRVKMIRELNEELGVYTSILADLQGPKLRVGVMAGEVVVDPDDEINFVTGKAFEGNSERVYMNYDNFPKDVKPGERILLDDGKLIFEVLSTNKKDEVRAKVLQGGPLKSKKGVNLPNTDISLPALTE
ncbi:MAG: pyruvate kinase, partial [Bacteroidota bacterium]